MAIYLKIPGINGGATEKNHKDWVTADSLQFGVHRPMNSPIGGGANREGGFPNVSEVVFTKPKDNASIELFGWSVGKFDAKTVKIDIVSAGRNDPYTCWELTNAVVSGYSVSCSGEGLPHESVSLNFTKIQEKFTPYGVDQKAGTPVLKGYDLSENKPL